MTYGDFTPLIVRIVDEAKGLTVMADGEPVETFKHYEVEMARECAYMLRSRRMGARRYG